jgi:hypothetical protein
VRKKLGSQRLANAVDLILMLAIGKGDQLGDEIRCEACVLRESTRPASNSAPGHTASSRVVFRRLSPSRIVIFLLRTLRQIVASFFAPFGRPLGLPLCLPAGESSTVEFTAPEARSETVTVLAACKEGSDYGKLTGVPESYLVSATNSVVRMQNGVL